MLWQLRPRRRPPPAPVDPIVEQLRELANGKFDRIVGDKKNRAAFDALLRRPGYAPIWITDGKFNERAAAAIDYLGAVSMPTASIPADYPVPNISRRDRSGAHWRKPKCGSPPRS